MFSTLLSTITDPNDLQFMIQLCEDNKELMYNTARRFTADPTLQDDVVQESLLKLIEKIPLLRSLECCRLEAYIVSTIRNTVYNEFRKAHVRRKYHDPMPKEESAAPATLEEMHHALFQKHRLSAVWKELTEKEKILLEGKYLLGYSDKELAAVLKCKPGSIRMMLTRTRRHAIKLITKLEDE